MQTLHNYQHVFFIGVAGTGMSALAQFAAGLGIQVSGSDRYFVAGQPNHTQQQLEEAGIACFPQDGSGIVANTDLVVISTAVEDSNPELQKAIAHNIPVVKRSAFLTMVSQTKRTIAVGGTSGKSTTTAMIFDILHYAGLEPSIISGAGLIRLQKEGKIGNAHVGSGEWLVIEADESDGSIVGYTPEIGLLLNIDKDHKEIDELLQLFTLFKQHSTHFVVNAGHVLAAPFSQNAQFDFSAQGGNVGYIADDFVQTDFSIGFAINHVPFTMEGIGRHNMENALAAVAVAQLCGVSLPTCAEGLAHYKGIYRRNQLICQREGFWLIDDYAHNPAKVAAAINGVQPLADKVIAWFQPHGYGPTKFLRHDFVHEIARTLRPQDEIWMSEIFYAGGTAVKDISAADLINDLKALGVQAYFVADRNQLVTALQPHLTNNCVLLLMGARDPSLDSFANQIAKALW